MPRWILFLCLGTLLSLNSSRLQETSDIEESGEDLDYQDDGSDEIDYQESILNPNSTETDINVWSGRRAGTQKRGKQRIWKVIRREVRDMKNFLPNLANNISWMELDVKDMNKNYFSLIGDIRVIKSEVMIIKKLTHTIWQNVTDTRRDHKRMNKTLWWILNNMTIVIEDVEVTAKQVTDMSKSYGTVITKLDDAVTRISDLSGFSRILEDMSMDFGQIKSSLKTGSDQINDDVKILSDIVFKMGHALFEIRDNVSRLFPRRDHEILSKVSEVSVAIASQSQSIQGIYNNVGDMTTDVLQAIRRIEEIWMLMKTLDKHVDVVGEKVLTMNYNVSKVHDGVVLVDEKVTLIGSNLVEIYRQLGDLGLNMTAFGIQFGGLSSSINSMHHNFDRVDTHLGDVHSQIISNVGSIKGDLDEMKVQLRDMRGVIAEKCEASCKHQPDTDYEENTCPPVCETPIGADGHDEHPKPDDPQVPGYPPSPPGQPTPPYPVPPIPDYPLTPPHSSEPTPDYPPTMPHPTQPTLGYPPTPPRPIHPQDPVHPRPGHPHMPGYPPISPHPVYPAPGYPPTSPHPVYPAPGYPPVSSQPVPPISEYPTTTLYPQTTVFVPYPSYPSIVTPGYPPPYPTTTVYPPAYPTTVVYPSPYPSTTFHPPTSTSYPPWTEYPLPPSVPAGVPGSSELPRPSTPGDFAESSTPLSGIELPAGPVGPGIPIGCGDEFTGICACACPCECTCPIIEHGLLPSKSSIYERLSLYRQKECQCICSCPCAIETTPAPPLPPVPRPADKTDGECTKKLIEDVIREIHGLYEEIDDVKKKLKIEDKKTRDVILDEVDKKFDDFSREIRVILDANFNLHTDTYNITFVLQDIKSQLFDEINRIAWLMQAMGVDIIKAIFRIMYGDSGNAHIDPQDAIRPPMRPDGRPLDLLPPGRPHNSRPDHPPSHHHRPPTHMPGMRPGRPPVNHVGRPGRPPLQHPMQGSVWEELASPSWPPSPVGGTLVQDYPRTPRPELYYPLMDAARRQRNDTTPTNTTTEISENSALALRMLPNNTPENTMRAVKKLSGKKKNKKKNKKKKKDCITTERQSEARVQSSRLYSPKEIVYPDESVDYEDYRGIDPDGDGYDVELVPDGSAKEPGTEVSIPNNNLGVIEAPMDPFAFHNIIQKHINNQWMKAVRPGSIYHAKGKRRPFGHWRGRTRDRYKVAPRPLLPLMPGFPFIPPPIPPIALPNPLRIRPPPMPPMPPIPPIPPIPSVPDIFASLPHRINGSPYSVSYNDGRGTSWNVNVNRRSNDFEGSGLEEDVSKEWDEEDEHEDEEAYETEEEHQDNESQKSEEEKSEEEEDQENEEDETNESTEHQ